VFAAHVSAFPDTNVYTSILKERGAKSSPEIKKHQRQNLSGDSAFSFCIVLAMQPARFHP